MSTEMGDWTRAINKRAGGVDCTPERPTQPNSTSAKPSPIDILTETLPFIDDPDEGNVHCHSLQISMYSSYKSCLPGDGAGHANVQKDKPRVDRQEETPTPYPAWRKHGICDEETSHLRVWNEVTSNEEWHDVCLEDDQSGSKWNSDGPPDRGTSATFRAEPTADPATTLTQKTLRLLASPRQLLLQSMMRPHSRQSRLQKSSAAANTPARSGPFLRSSPSDPQGWLQSPKFKAASKARQADAAVADGRKLPYRTLSTPTTAVRTDLPLHAFQPTASERSFARSTRVSWVLGVTRKNRSHRSCCHQGNSALHGLQNAAEDSPICNSKTEGGMMSEAKISNQQIEHFRELPASQDGKGRVKRARFYQSAGPGTAVMLATARHLAGESRKVHQRLRKHLLSVLMCGMEDSVSERPPTVQQILEQLQYHPHTKSF